MNSTDATLWEADGFEPMRQGDTFVDLAGPIWRRVDEHGATLRMIVEQRHTNPNGTVHGGLLMTMMDLALGSGVEGGMRRGDSSGKGHPTTMQLSCSFVGAARLGEVLHARADVDRMSRSVCFASGRISADDRLLMTASAVFKIPSPGSA